MEEVDYTGDRGHAAEEMSTEQEVDFEKSV